MNRIVRGDRPGSLRRGFLSACLASALLPACAGRADRMEATVHWAGVDIALTSGAARVDGDRARVVLAFVPRLPASGGLPLAVPTLEAALFAGGQPWLLLELVFREPGRAGFDNLQYYVVRMGRGAEGSLRVERRSKDWVREGGIDLSGEVRAGARLLGRLRRAGVAGGDTAARPWRWDIGFDTVLAAA